MESLYQLVLERNDRETSPFVAIHESNALLLIQIDALQARCEDLERDLVVQQEKLESVEQGGDGQRTQSAALKNETRLRDKLEKLQEELAEKMKLHAEDQTNALKVARELSDIKDLTVSQETTITDLNEEKERKDRAIEHLTSELTDAKSRTKLAEQQYVGLKDTIRVLQEENDLIKKENRELETRFVSEKEKMSDEMNKFSEMCDRLKKEVDMLRGLKAQEEKRKSWFGLSSVDKNKASVEKKVESDESNSRKWGDASVVLPSTPKQVISAHHSEASCVR
jgi:autophagy-related protein 16